MNIQDRELSLEVVPGETFKEDVRTLRSLASVAGLLVELEQRDGAAFLHVRYNENFTEFIRNRNAGRPRSMTTGRFTCKEVFSARESDGSKAVAQRLGMSLATFYRRCNDNKGKNGDDPFL
jgi:hypothetical protein